ncbi:MAG: AbiEi antitoxin N-terminal domain-containing protein [Pseudomonadota bacterium]|nr:AbiEi antitoxin N-terminal domain-containing protein [Burkholderiaceae bacterium]MDQ3446807.1 AbiEi antitoxin N-terminal domain-containing protein [Pseudomonadota bacterium]
MPITDRDRTLRLARRRRGVTSRDLAAAGIHRQVLTRLVAEEQLERVARGLYRLPEQSITEHHALAVAAAAVPQGVVCLLSALQFHRIGSQLPSQVWMALDRRAWHPALRYPQLRIVRYTGAALTEGVESHVLEGRAVHVYDVAKTLADCFKYRNKIGLDVALEALREAWRARRFSMNALDRYAAICRVQRVMRPYVEALVA